MNDQEAHDFYKREGYILFEKLVPEDVIDQLVGQYFQQIKNSGRYFFRQNKNYWTKNTSNEFGHVKDSFLDPHQYDDYPEFREAFRAVVMHKRLLEKLQIIINEQGIKLMQSMFFDLNTATWPHADNWYLDSVPNGHLLGAWIALENIHPDAGQFYIVKGTNKPVLNLDEKELISDKLHREKVSSYLHRYHPDGKGYFKPQMNKGDVLFWNSQVLHGSTATKNPRFSRKSVTAHFMPARCEFGNIKHVYSGKLEFERFNECLYRVDSKEYSPLQNAKTKVLRKVFDHFPGLVSIKKKLKPS